MKDLETSDPKAHTENIKEELQKLVDHLRKDIGQVDEPQAKALFETSAEVLLGLKTAFIDYEKGEEAAWQ